MGCWKFLTEKWHEFCEKCDGRGVEEEISPEVHSVLRKHNSRFHQSGTSWSYNRLES